MKILDYYFIGLLVAGITYCFQNFILEFRASRMDIKPVYDENGNVIGEMIFYKKLRK